MRLFLTKKAIGIQTDKEDTYINALILSSCEEIEATGIRLISSMISDDELIARYTAWKYRSRKTGENMPDSLKFAIHNRLIHEKGRCDRD